jgi:hypothetical protein
MALSKKIGVRASYARDAALNIARARINVIKTKLIWAKNELKAAGAHRKAASLNTIICRLEEWQKGGA